MNSKIIITLFSLFAELERDMISLRTKESLLAKKTQGIKLGKPKGTLQKSKVDKDIEKIRELLGYGLSIRKIAKVLGYTSHIALNTYILISGHYDKLTFDWKELHYGIIKHRDLFFM